MRGVSVIDFSAASRRPWWGVAALLVAGGLLAWQVFEVHEVRARLDDQRQGMQALFVPNGGAGSSTMSSQDSRRHAQIEAVAAYLAAPWDTLLSAFESHSKRGVVIRRLEPDASTGVVRMVGEAPSLKVMMDYVLALEADQRLQQVMLVNHDVVGEGGNAPGAIEFTLSAAWRSRGAAAAARTAETGTPAAEARQVADVEQAATPGVQP
ncbi:MAG: hypothetical protein RLY71_173 [Pseudomonadota bacterium]|jgi:hypothetical protein